MAGYEQLLQAALIIGVFSFALWKENPYFRFCEHALLGTALGYSVVMTVKTIYSTAVFPLLRTGELIYLMPLILGLALYLRFSRKTIWISRWPIAIITGVGLALGMRGMVFTFIVSQVKATATLSIITGNAVTNFNNMVVFLTTILVLILFTFTILRGEAENSVMYRIRKVSRMLIMVTLGAYFGSVTLSRLSLVAEQIRLIMVAFGLLPG